MVSSGTSVFKLRNILAFKERAFKERSFVKRTRAAGFFRLFNTQKAAEVSRRRRSPTASAPQSSTPHYVLYSTSSISGLYSCTRTHRGRSLKAAAPNIRVRQPSSQPVGYSGRSSKSVSESVTKASRRKSMEKSSNARRGERSVEIKFPVLEYNILHFVA